MNATFRGSGDSLIVALDTADLGRLSALAETLGPHVAQLKVGLTAYAAHGPGAVAAVAAHAPVFLDVKLHDIPHQVAGAAAVIADLGVDMLTVHASGGPAMITAAVDAAPGLRVLAVTVLTSLGDDELALLGQPPAAEQVPRLAELAVDAGASGLVCAPTDVAAVRSAVGQEPLIVTPGIRPRGAGADDQARVSTPAQALDAGADYLVVGRPVTTADDPAAAVRALADELRTRG